MEIFFTTASGTALLSQWTATIGLLLLTIIVAILAAGSVLVAIGMGYSLTKKYLTGRKF